jgi:hypothetical protein
MTYAQKKELYGVPNRIAVGGKSDLDPPDNQKGALSNILRGLTFRDPTTK